MGNFSDRRHLSLSPPQEDTSWACHVCRCRWDVRTELPPEAVQWFGGGVSGVGVFFYENFGRLGNPVHRGYGDPDAPVKLPPERGPLAPPGPLYSSKIVQGIPDAWPHGPVNPPPPLPARANLRHGFHYQQDGTIVDEWGRPVDGQGRPVTDDRQA